MRKTDVALLKDMMDEHFRDSTYSMNKKNSKTKKSRRDRLEINNTEKTDKNAKESRMCDRKPIGQKRVLTPTGS